jgi:P27 family predicted phage terminase small subunit
MRGRKPKPTQRQITEGDPRQRGKGKLQNKLDSEPHGEKGLPPCPIYLQGNSRVAYEYWRDQLEKMNLAEMPDALTLERAAVQYALASEADAHITQDGAVILEPIVSRTTGDIVGHRQKRNEWVSIRAEADRIFRQFASDFGLSPVSRTRLTIEKKDKETDDLMQLLGAPRVRRDASAVQ